MGLSAKDISLAAINKVLKKTQLFDFVESLPLGISTWVGERGTKLSGGQKQRLSIARALLTNPGLIVLDEATSALDTETEKTLIDFFEEVRGQLTLIIIAHRLSTVKSVSSGDFEFLRKNNQNFEKQAALSGY
jgi:ABC-type bacteriocin/lantibiotic exporter with double-glycine peptidase domain